MSKVTEEEVLLVWRALSSFRLGKTPEVPADRPSATERVPAGCELSALGRT